VSDVEIERSMELRYGSSNIVSPETLGRRTAVHLGRLRIANRKYAQLRWNGFVSWSQSVTRVRFGLRCPLTIRHSELISLLLHGRASCHRRVGFRRGW
jgi:hypothetical protein